MQGRTTRSSTCCRSSCPSWRTSAPRFGSTSSPTSTASTRSSASSSWGKQASFSCQRNSQFLTRNIIQIDFFYILLRREGLHLIFFCYNFPFPQLVRKMKSGLRVQSIPSACYCGACWGHQVEGQVRQIHFLIISLYLPNSVTPIHFYIRCTYHGIVTNMQ